MRVVADSNSNGFDTRFGISTPNGCCSTQFKPAKRSKQKASELKRAGQEGRGGYGTSLAVD